MKIELINEAGFERADMLKSMERVIKSAVRFAASGFAGFEVSLTVTGDEDIRRLNREYRSVDAVTDVLSFPLLDFEECADDEPADYTDGMEEYKNPETGLIMLGDIVINMDRAFEQAEQYGHSPQREACYLCAHSVLHLFGYDHMTDFDKERMRALEEEIMDDAGLSR